MPTTYPTDLKVKTIRRYERGESIQALSQELHISQSTLYQWRNEYCSIEMPNRTYTPAEFNAISRRLQKLEHHMEIIRQSGYLSSVPLQKKLATLEQLYNRPNNPYSVHELCDALVMEAHKAARHNPRGLPRSKGGLTLSLHDIQALPGGEEAAQKDWDDELTHYLPALEDDDFLGVQNYTRSRYDATGSLPAPEGAELTQMNYEFYPEGLEHVIRRVAEAFRGDLIVTENGIATADDTRRVAYIERALEGVQRCVADGLPVKGYFYWSLMDNFEWQKGFAMQFGLVAVDRANGQTRTPKPSLAYLGSYRG